MNYVCSREDRRGFLSVDLGFVIYWLISVGLLVDSFNGYFVKFCGFGVSAPYKGLIFLLIFLYLKSLSLVFGWVAFFCLYYLYFLCVGFSSVAIYASLVWFLKFSLIVYSYFFFSKFIKVHNVKFLFFYGYISFFIVVCNILFGTFGYGSAQYYHYGESIGSKGFIYSGNELAVVFVSSASIIFAHLLYNEKYLKFFIFAFVAIVASSFAGTKVSFFSALIFFLISPFLQGKIPAYCFRLAIVRFIVLLIFPCATIVAWSVLFFETNLVIRINHFLNKMDYVTLFFSSRNVFAADAVDVVRNYYSFFDYVFGTCFQWVAMMPDKIVELDFIDVFMTFGFFGIILVYGFFIFIIVKMLCNNFSPFRLHFFCTLFLLLIVSSMAGHVVFSGVAAPLIGAICSFANFISSKSNGFVVLQRSV